MKKDYSVELIGTPKTLSDFDFNELKLNALICEIEQEILNIRLKRLVLKNVPPSSDPVIPVSVKHSSRSVSWWGRFKSFFSGKS